MLIPMYIPIVVMMVISARAEVITKKSDQGVAKFSSGAENGIRPNKTKYVFSSSDLQQKQSRHFKSANLNSDHSSHVDARFDNKYNKSKITEVEYMRRDDDMRSEDGDRRSRHRHGSNIRHEDDDDDDSNRRRDRNDKDDHRRGQTPDFRHCGGNAVRLHVTRFPNPLMLKEGERLHMAFTATVSERLPEPIYARISIKKKVLGLWNRIPCVGRVGSCEYKVTCDKIRKKYGGKINQPCPPPIGKTEREFTFTMPKIPRIVRSFATGSYQIQAKLFTKKRGKGELLACSETQVRVQT